MKDTPLLSQRTRYESKSDEHRAALQRLVGLLTEQDVCLLLEVSEHTLQAWRQLSKGPPYVKLEKSIFYRVEDIEDWVDSNVVPTGAKHGEAIRDTRSLPPT